MDGKGGWFATNNEIRPWFKVAFDKSVQVRAISASFHSAGSKNPDAYNHTLWMKGDIWVGDNSTVYLNQKCNLDSAVSSFSKDGVFTCTSDLWGKNIWLTTAVSSDITPYTISLIEFRVYSYLPVTLTIKTYTPETQMNTLATQV